MGIQAAAYLDKWKCLSLVFSLCIMLLPQPGITATQDTSLPNTGEIVGAGAHFSWIIFNRLKPELEKLSGRKIILYGKDSMLGQGCNAGIKTAKLSNNKRDSFGFICCALSKEEIIKNNLRVYPLANEPIVILVNTVNPVSNLSQQQLRDIFKGRINNWKTVGGPDKPIVVVTRLHCKQRPGHWKRILPSEKDFTTRRINVTSADDMVHRVSDFEGAIGHIGSTWVYESGNKTRAITIDHQAATAANLQNGKYPFYRKLSAVTTMNPNPDVIKIIRRAQTGPGFRLLAKEFELLPLVPEKK